MHWDRSNLFEGDDVYCPTVPAETTLFCRRHENVSISRLVFTYNKKKSIPFSDMLTLVFL